MSAGMKIVFIIKKGCSEMGSLRHESSRNETGFEPLMAQN
jgi:hypothetical protein